MNWRFLLSFCLAAFLGLQFAGYARASSSDSRDLWHLLWESHQQAKDLSYEGTLVTVQGNISQSNRLKHISSPEGEFELLERLEGEPVTWLRHNERIQCVLPERKLVISESRKTSLVFPRMMGNTETLGNLSQLYRISEMPSERVAGRSVRVLQLEPLDERRYEYRLYVDRQKRLLLKTQSYDSGENLLEQVSFTEINFDLGDKQPTGLFEVGAGWRESVSKVEEVDENHVPFVLPDQHAGFQKMETLCRVKEERSEGHREVHQSIFSDGLSSVSVFVQKANPEARLPSVPMKHGAVTSLTQLQGDYMVTILGEVPEVTVREFLNLIQWQNNHEGKPK
ncbi:MAG: MucB/RseB C-terminal domain-containing protein [Limnobacter sp.]|nr:MucB/RseB C-terminal domain-containing protein [Limnobacter sp.]